MGQHEEHAGDQSDATETRTDAPAAGDEGQGAAAGDDSTDGERDQPTE